MLPKLYRITHPNTPHLVVFTDPAGRKVRRYFKDRAEAETYHRQLLRTAQVSGTAGLVLDAEMRAEYFAARKALDGISLATAVRFYLEHQPTGLSATPLAETLDLFLRDKKRTGRAERTISSLRSTLLNFLGTSSATRACDFTRNAVTDYLDALKFPPLTIRNHRARLETFGDWLARRQYIRENPVRYIEVVHHDYRPPVILLPCDARKIMNEAISYRGGIFAAQYAIALFAGLRLGEITRLIWEDFRLDNNPIIRVGRGKIRGRRAVRIVPIEPALLSWLKWVRRKGLPLVCDGDSRKIRQTVPWQPDICRHSWISYRLALIGNETQVAREAGNSPEIIYRHYFQLVSRLSSISYNSCWAPTDET